jgi:hypothetical protein
MNSYGSLPMTGATVTIGGLVLDQSWLLGAGIGVVILGAFVARFAFRRHKTMLDL